MMNASLRTSSLAGLSGKASDTGITAVVAIKQTRHVSIKHVKTGPAAHHGERCSVQ